MRSCAPHFDTLRAYLETVPLVDCHDHSVACGPKHTDPIQAIITGYFASDIHSASSDAEAALIQDVGRSLEERWPVLERAWKRTCHTGYAQVTRRVLKHFYGEDDLTLDALRRIEKKLPDYSDPVLFEKVLEEANIAVRIEDAWPDPASALDGTFKPSPGADW